MLAAVKRHHNAEAGKPFILEVGKQVLNGTVGKTGSRETFKTQKTGQIELPAGKQKVLFKPKIKFEKGSLIDLRQIIFFPVK